MAFWAGDRAPLPLQKYDGVDVETLTKLVSGVSLVAVVRTERLTVFGNLLLLFEKKQRILQCRMSHMLSDVCGVALDLISGAV